MGAVVALPVACMMAGFPPELSGFRATGAREVQAATSHATGGTAPLNHLGGKTRPNSPESPYVMSCLGVSFRFPFLSNKSGRTQHKAEPLI